MIERFLRNVAPALNQDPQAQGAISVTTTNSVTIVVHDGVMQVEGLAIYELPSYTVASIASSLSSLSGIQAHAIGYGSLSALALVDGTYESDCTIPVFTSPLWQAGMTASQELDSAEQQSNNALFQATPHTASGPWLDSLGNFYGVPREPGEPDQLYAIRVFDFSLGPRVNNIAMEKVLADLGYQATVTDTTPGPAFTVTVQIPPLPPQGYVYSIASISDMIDLLKAAGVNSTITLEGSLQDTIHISDSISSTTNQAAWKVGDSLTIGQFTV